MSSYSHEWLWVCLQWRVSCGREPDVSESTPEFAAWHHPGVWEQYGGTTCSPMNCSDAKQLPAAFYCFSMNNVWWLTTLCCRRCWASGRGCAEARVSPVTSFKLGFMICLLVVLYCLCVDGMSKYIRCVSECDEGNHWLGSTGTQCSRSLFIYPF